MVIIVAYDRDKNEPDPIDKVILVIIGVFLRKRWLDEEDLETQFLYTLNTTIEARVPILANNKKVNLKDVKDAASKISAFLSRDMHVRVGYSSEIFGRANDFSQGQFVDRIKEALKKIKEASKQK